MILIQIDLSEVENTSGGLELALDALREAIPEQLQFIQSVWQEAVQGRMLPGMSRVLHDQRYAAAIADPSALQYPFEGDEFSGAVICVDGGLANRIEKGYASFDMKPGLLGGPNAKTDAKGHRYNTIPFGHSTPGSQGQKGAPMPQEVYAQAKTLSAGQRLKLKGALAGIGIRSKLPFAVNAEAIRRGKPGPMTATGYTWKNSPYEGMQKVAKKGHVSYMSFRRVSDTSDHNSWIHPGMAPNPVVEAVGHYVEPIVLGNLQKVVEEALP